MARGGLWRGAFWLSIGALVSKMIGAVYRIFLPRVLGVYGVGLFQLAYPLYALILAISVNGIPTALSKQTAEKIAQGDEKGAEVLSAWAQLFLGLLGVLMAAAVELLAPWIARQVFDEPAATLSIRALAPALIFVAVEAGLRGYFQGMQDMAPTAVSQILEQVARVAVMFPMALLWLDRGPAWAAAGATLGAPAGAVAGMGYLAYARMRRRTAGLSGSVPWRELGRLVKVALPMSLAGLLFPLMFLADSIFVPRQLVASGMSLRHATAQFGLLSGEAMPLINVTMVLGAALAVSLVPAVARSMSEHDRQAAAGRVNVAIHLIWLLGLPMAGGLFILAHPLTVLLYGSDKAAGALEVLALGSGVLAVQQVIGSSLQASGHGWLTVKNLAFAAALKFVLTWRLTAMAGLGIKGAALSTVLASLTAMALNWHDWQRIARPEENPWSAILWPLGGTVIMAMGVQTWYALAARGLCGFAGILGPTLSAVAVGVTIYVIIMAAAGEMKLLKSLRG